MNKEDLSNILQEISKVKKQIGANPFSAKSYLKAADIIINLNEPIEFHDFPSIKGIGPKIAANIYEFLETGKIQWLENKKKTLKIKYPSFNSMNSELTDIHGIGLKTAKLIYKETGITKLEELKKAIKNGSLNKIFQPKTLKNINEQIQYGAEKKMPREEGLKIAKKIMRSLKPYYKKMEIMGSYRRKKAMVGDIDFIAQTDNPILLMEKFCNLKYVKKIKQGEKVSQVRFLENGTKIDLYIFKKQHWGPALQFLSGSGAHNRQFREIAIGKGLLINRYGVWNRDKSKRFDNGTEESVYNIVGFKWIPPEERNGTDEFLRYKL